MPAIGHFAELRDSGIVFLQIVSSSDDRQRDSMVFLARDEAAEGMANNGRPRLELADRVGVVISDLLYPLAGKDLRVVIRLCDGLRVIGPARCESRVALLFKECTPAIPTG